MKKLFVIITLFYFAQTVAAQDTTISQAFKFNSPSQTYELNKKNRFPSHPLVSSYYLLQEAKKGNPLAEHELGLRYLLGEGFEADTARAVYWIYKAAQSKLPPACFNMGLLLNQGIGVDWDPFSAYDYFKCAAKLGMPAAQYIFGVLHSYTMLVNKNLGETYKWVKLSAQQGFKPAIELLKSLRESGINFEETAENLATDDTSQVSATSYLLMDDSSIKNNFGVTPISIQEDSSVINANDKSKLKAFFNSPLEKLQEKLGFVAGEKKNQGETEKDSLNGFALVLEAAKAGSPEALLLLGKAYELGVGVEQDSLKAIVNYIRAYRLGANRAWSLLVEKAGSEDFFKNLKTKIDEEENTEAMYVWGSMALLGFNYQITEKQAVEMLEKAAKKNYEPALIEAGKIYFSGKFADKDTAKAYAYWREAAELGSLEAEVRLAFTKLNDAKTDKKAKKEAFAKLEQAANRGSILAQSLLGLAYEKGIGVIANKGKAAELYRFAASRGNEAAYHSLRRMYDEIRPSDREEFYIYEEN